MGRIAVVLRVDDNDDLNEKIRDIQIDVGGGELLTVPLLAPSGIDVSPLPGDYAATVDYPGDSGEVAVAFGDPDNSPKSAIGEIRIYGRDSEGVVKCELWLKNDGSIRAENENGFFELGTNGQVNINNNFSVDP